MKSAVDAPAIGEHPLDGCGFPSAVRADVWRLYGRYSGWLLLKAVLHQRFFRPGFAYRLFRACMDWPVLARVPVQLALRLLHRRMTARRCMQFPLECASIGPGLLLIHSYGLLVNGRARIGSNVTLLHHVTIGGARGVAPSLGDNVTVADGGIVIGAVAIGPGATIGAGAVVSEDVPPLAVMTGNPASLARYDTAPRTSNAAPLDPS